MAAGVALAATTALAGDELSFAQRASLPPWVVKALARPEVAGRYQPCACLDPFYRRGDFDGDGAADHAVLAGERADLLGRREVRMAPAGRLTSAL